MRTIGIKYKQHPSQQEIKKVLDYNPETGIFTRKNLAKKGQGYYGRTTGTKDTHGHIRIMINKTRYAAHRLAWIYVYGDDLPKELDHINGIRNDNRICNLRIATRSLNNANRKKRGHSSLPKGIEPLPSGRYSARIQYEGKRHYIGSYDTAEEAHDAYFIKAKELFGEYARA